MSKGAFPPTVRGSAHGCRERFPFGSSIYTGAGPRTVSICGCPISRHCFIDLSISTNQRSLFLRIPQKNRSMSDPAGARSGPAAEAQRTCGGVNITHFLQTDPLRNQSENCTQPLLNINPSILLNTCIPGKKYDLFEQYFFSNSRVVLLLLIHAQGGICHHKDFTGRVLHLRKFYFTQKKIYYFLARYRSLYGSHLLRVV